MTIQPNNQINHLQPLNQQGQISSFHDRAALVIFDILEQLNFSKDKLKNIANILMTINDMPSFVFIPFGENAKGIKKMIEDIQPVLHLVLQNDDPSYYLKMIPEEKILYFLNQVITRLEWVKNGNGEISES